MAVQLAIARVRKDRKGWVVWVRRTFMPASLDTPMSDWLWPLSLCKTTAWHGPLDSSCTPGVSAPLACFCNSNGLAYMPRCP